MTETALVRFDAAKRALAEARTIDEVKDVRDKAEALRLYMRQAGESLQMQNDVAEIKLRAERRAGELLGDMDKRDGGDAMRARSQGATEVPPTLAELGLSKSQSSRWQAIADMPAESFEQHIASTKARNAELTTAGMLRLARDIKRQETRDEMVKCAQDVPLDGPNYRLICGDMATAEPGPCDVIITDPPYPAEYLHLYKILAERAAQWLPEGGSLLVMCGQSYLTEILAMMTPHLTYRWMLAYLTPGGQSAQLWARTVNTFWKPVLWFTRGDYAGPWIGDVLTSDTNDKRFHGWGQSESGMAQIVERFSQPGQTVLDPFCGAGTTGVVALRLSRRFVGIDTDVTSVDLCRARLAEIADA